MTDIMLFAAGLGTRMGPLTVDRPKPLVLVNGAPLISHALDLTQIERIDQRVANVHYRSDQMRPFLTENAVTISDETDLLRETGGGLRHALPLLNGDPILTLNTDAIWAGPNPIEIILDAWRDEMDCLLMLVPKERVHGHKGKGDFNVQPTGQLKRGRSSIYTGLQMIRRRALDGIDDDVFSLNRAWDNADAKGTLFGIQYPGSWCDVGQPDSIPLAERLLSRDADV